ncbi:MAG: hypothetical protein A3G87_09145 [Omnitrophica bacterium RIFCSPLOWO2_12_FULL_50_11]|nr:MAG: hypothetical protein A3G87_09145 [Omnitrophica bacterium RIFCSPLOWO2_12_FULL_50_11]
MTLKPRLSTLHNGPASSRGAGFTLVELLMVITVLGILAAIALPRFFPQTEKSRVAEAVGILSAIRQGEEAYFLERGVYLALPVAGATWAQLGLDDPNVGANNYFTYDVAIAAAAFTAHATRTGVALPAGAAAIGTIIGLSGDGNYCGGHPNTPPNRGTAAPATCPR